MPSESRFSQTATLIGASALGIIAMVVVPRHCHQDTASQSDLMVAPAPDAIGSRPSNAAMTAPHVAGVKAKSKADTAQFLAQANELLKRPLEAMSDQLDELMTQWASSDPVHR